MVIQKLDAQRVDGESFENPFWLVFERGNLHHIVVQGERESLIPLVEIMVIDEGRRVNLTVQFHFRQIDECQVPGVSRHPQLVPVHEFRPSHYVVYLEEFGDLGLLLVFVEDEDSPAFID